MLCEGAGVPQAHGVKTAVIGKEGAVRDYDEVTIHTKVRDLAGHPVEPPRNNEVLEQQVKVWERALERSHERLEVLMDWNIANSIQATNPSSPSN